MIVNLLKIDVKTRIFNAFNETTIFFKFMGKLQFIDYFTIASSIAVVIGVIFGFHTWRKSMAIKRAEYVQSLREKFYDDKDVSEVIYTIDYGMHWYDSSFHGGTDMERKVDKTLSVCDHICYLYVNKLISGKEFEIFEYDLYRILNNDDFVDYLYNVSYWANNELNLKSPFSQLLQYSEKYLKKGISDSKSLN